MTDWRDSVIVALAQTDFELDAKGFSATLRDLALKRATNWSASMAQKGPPAASGEYFAAILGDQLTGAETWLQGQVDAAIARKHRKGTERAERDNLFAEGMIAIGGQDAAAAERYRASLPEQSERWEQRILGERI
jgi:hypothetical protein